MAAELGAFPGHARNADHMLRVIRNHRRAAYGDASGNGPEYEGLSVLPVAIREDECPNRNLVAAARRAYSLPPRCADSSSAVASQPRTVASCRVSAESAAANRSASSCALAIAALLAGCAVPQKNVDYTAFRESKPASILVLPPVNSSVDVAASDDSGPRTVSSCVGSAASTAAKCSGMRAWVSKLSTRLN